MKKGLLPLYIVLFTVYLLPQQLNKEYDKSNRTAKISVNDFYNFIAVNRIEMWVSNNGDGSHHPKTDGSGFLWPRQNYLPAIFEDGLLYGCRQDDSIKVNGNTHRQGLQAGKILPDGNADNPSLSKYRVYRIRKDWESFPPGPEREQLKRDYLEWPAEDGATNVIVNEGNSSPAVLLEREGRGMFPKVKVEDTSARVQECKSTKLQDYNRSGKLYTKAMAQLCI